MASGEERKVIATNRRARFEFEVLDRYEAGIALVGPEVKSLRAGKATLTDAYASVRRGEVWLQSLHISPYDPASRENGNPRRERKLLLHRREIAKLEGRVQESGLTLVPLSLYFQGGRVKVELALARGKRRHDKRETIKKRETDRDLRRVMRDRNQRG